MVNLKRIIKGDEMSANIGKIKRKTSCLQNPLVLAGLILAIIPILAFALVLRPIPSNAGTQADNSQADKSPPGKSQVDNRIYADLLKKHVKGKRVNYEGFKNDETSLDNYLAILSSSDVDALSRDNRFAFYINVYNAFTIKLILTKYPGINSIKEIGSFFSNPWSKKFIPLKGRIVSLDHIEHDILRPIFKDPRMHFAINCASKSCPPLLNLPYEGDKLDAQLNAQTRAFINDPKNTFLKDNTLFASKIFQWFEDDFNGNTLLFIKQYSTDEFRKKLDAAGQDIKFTYNNYDWTLNR
jgi:hypothetical protein